MSYTETEAMPVPEEERETGLQPIAQDEPGTVPPDPTAPPEPDVPDGPGPDEPETAEAGEGSEE